MSATAFSGKPWVLAVGCVLAAAAVIGATVVVEHRIHGIDAATADDAHGDDAHEDDAHEAHADRVILTEAGRGNAGVVTEPAKGGSFDVVVTLPAEVALDRERVAHVTPRITGTVRESRKALGDSVAPGEVLAVLESREVAAMSREVAAASERLALADASFRRIDGLYRDGVASEKEYLAAKHALAEARVDRDGARAMLSASGATGSPTLVSLVSPIGGTVIEKALTLGEVVRDDAPAFVIADLSSTWVEVTLYPRDLERVALGQSVRLSREGDDQGAVGTISFIGALASGGSRATRARVVLDHPPPEWRPGLYLTANVTIAHVEAATFVESRSVQTVDGEPTVFIDANGGFDARRVALGRSGKDAATGAAVVEVTHGLTVGEPVVTAGAFILKAELGKSEAGHED